jgi:GNAT superfamily N-acetyltransferase
VPAVADPAETDAVARDVRLREATLADAAALARLMGVLGYPTSAAAMASRLEVIGASAGSRTVVAEVEGEVRGMVGLRRVIGYEMDGSFVLLIAMAVDAAWQGRGIGTALVREAECWAREQGAGAIALTTAKHRAGAHRFYERLGYAATGLRFVKRLDR